MRRIAHEENGVTLIELLLVLAISSLLIGIATMILMSSLTAFDRLTADREVRNEANYITMVINDALKNTESVEILDHPADPKNITHFLSKEVIKEIVNGQEVERYKTIEIEIAGNDLDGYNLYLTVNDNGTIDGKKQVNREAFSVKGSYFWLDSSSLQGLIRVEKEGSLAKPLYVYLSHKTS